MLSYAKCLLIGKCVRRFGTTTVACVSHYDVLGVTPKANQGEIKSAYYKLSMQYHPDKASNNAESAEKFRQITEAYEVLGNLRLKKMYDKGLLVGRESKIREYHPEPEPTDPTLKFYKSRTKRTVIPTMDGKTPIYDFDSWAKNHYGETFKKSQYEKELLKRKKAKQMDQESSVRQETYTYIIIFLTALFGLFVINGTDDYDKDLIKTPSDLQTNVQKA
ncbi:hypothetical protein JYU34_012151 [Plutella xylostella]|uniref:J domain-containing protein n=1 Tax=Plutella xylostella TaxID=51655 RepID=A0ABQ7QEX8_PLUXY|nr:hypothetical protein JYU34_012151 [Plutella xylostella]